MTVISVCSLRGAPGATTTALLLAGGLAGSVLVEADRAGGVLAIRYGLGREPGLVTMAADHANVGADVSSHLQSAGGVAVLVGPDSAEMSVRLWDRAGDRLTEALTSADAPDVVFDIGRLHQAWRLLAASDLVLVIIRPVAEQLVALHHRFPALREAAPTCAVGVVVVGSGPYAMSDLSDIVTADLTYALPYDERAGEALQGVRRGGRLQRSPLARAMTGLCTAVNELTSRGSEPSEVAP